MAQAKLLVEGWRFLPHSYAIVNQWQLLALRGDPRVELRVRDLPFYSPNWKAQAGLMGDAEEAALRALQQAPADFVPDVTLRIASPCDLSPAPVGRTTTTSHTSVGLENGTKYSFTVAAYTKAGDGPLSLAVSAMPLAPPMAVTATAGDHRVTLTWLPAAGATSYTINRRMAGEPEFTELTTGVLAPPFVDPNLTNGARYQYRVSAVTAASQSAWSEIVAAVPAPPKAAGR